MTQAVQADFLTGMKTASRPTGPLLALVIAALGFGLSGIFPALFGLNETHTSTLWGQFIMTASFALWIAVIFAWVALKEQRPIASLGFATGFRRQGLLGLVLGLGLTSLVVAVNLGLGNATLGTANWAALAPSALLLIGFGIQASAEEIAYRGYLMQAFSATWKAWIVVIAQAILFTLGHVGNGLNPVAVLTMLAVSYCLAMWILATNSLWGAMSFHIFWNWSQANVWGASVSNIKMDTHVFEFTAHPGTELISGGAFGLEGSVLTIAMLVGIGIYFHVRWAANRSSTR